MLEVSADGMCECGCGMKTPISATSDKRSGSVKGQHLRFIRGHNSKVAEKHPHWKGGRIRAGQGYVALYAPNHPNCTTTGYVMEHRLVIESMLGRYLTKDEVVHHINRVRSDNALNNLMPCADQGHHAELHRIEDARAACGNPSFRWCPHCKSYDDPVNLARKKSGRGYYHKNCRMRQREALSHG